MGLSLVIFVCFLQPTGAANPVPEEQAKLSSREQKIEELDRAGHYREAIPIAEEHLRLIEKTAGADSPETAASCDKLGELYRKNGEYSKAKPLCERGLEIREKVLGPDDPHTAESLDNLAQLYLILGNFTKAAALGERALAIAEKAFGPDHSNTAKILNHCAAVYSASGDSAKAESLFQRALKINEKTLGPEHPDTAESLNNLAFLYANTGDFAKAQPLNERALKIDEKVLGPEHPDTAASLHHLAEIYRQLAQFGEAETLHQRALGIRETRLGLGHAATADSLNDLAMVYLNKSDFAKAEPLFKRALTTAESAFGPDHRNVWPMVNNLGVLYRRMGDYGKAAPFLERGLSNREKAGPTALDLATSVNELAMLYDDMGDYAKAEPFYQRSLKILENGLGPDHPITGAATNNLAAFYLEMGDYAKAEPLLQRALEVDEKTVGPEHPYTATDLNNLGFCYRGMGDYRKAEPFLQRAVKVDEKVLGPENPNTSRDLHNLGALYKDMGDYLKAEPLLQRALRISEKTLGLDHPDTTKPLKLLACLYIDTVKTPEAIELALRAGKSEQKQLADMLSFTSEHQRLAFAKKVDPYRLLATLGRAFDLAEVVLRYKGVVLDSLLEDRLVAEASQDPKQREVIDEVRAAKRKAMQLLLEIPKDVSETATKRREAEKQELQKRVEKLEAGLAREFAGLGKARRALNVTVAQVQAALTKNNVLIELFRYNHYVGKNKSEPRYGAIAIASKGEPKWIALGNADKIDNLVQLYQKSARGQTDEATLSNVLRSLHDQVWAPIEKVLPAGTSTAIISPDAELSFVSFATLLTSDDRFVGEKYSIRYVASGRDLLREFKTANNSQTNVYANPDFGSKPASPDWNRGTTLALRSIEMRDLQSISLPPLPGTKLEAEALQKRFGSSAKVFLGPNATKAELRQVNSPRILHLATHGFFLPEIDLGKSVDPLQRGQEIPKGKLVNPMHRSGLALAGAQTTLQAWGRGEVPPIENNGVVTAEEVGGLKLDRTWLVVLSACETGSGEARAGEGVMGLRRGFIQAGAQNLLMTLWPISDQTTVQIMLDFYDAALKNGNAPQALADVQRDWLVKLRKERGLLEAVRLAGPFIMSSQGKP
ncbi:MAG TPA: CHAT domain-containing tetratricopeptide repeat protein [Chthoniobacterales bacterium]|nr:CHAT domain-containing tetratricopeptide repeat protein [Chthoniobacterales bacterium]